MYECRSSPSVPIHSGTHVWKRAATSTNRSTAISNARSKRIRMAWWSSTPGSSGGPTDQASTHPELGLKREGPRLDQPRDLVDSGQSASDELFGIAVTDFRRLEL